MKTYFITFRSVTFGQRGQQLLEKAGIPCSLQRTPRWMEEQGCGYCLKLRGEDCSRGVGLLRTHQVRFRKIYRQLDSGMEEVAL